MPELKVLPDYPVEWLRFVRSPGAYVEDACAPGRADAYSPWEAFLVGLALSAGIAAYDAHVGRGTALDKGTEQVNYLLVAALNLAVVHGACKALGGQALKKHMAAAFEYTYGFLLPAAAASATLLIALTGLLPGLRCTLSVATFECKDFPRSWTYILAVAAVQTAMFAVLIYALAVFNAVTARLHKLGRGKVAVAQAVGLALLFVLGNPLYSLSSWIAVRFKDLIGG